MKRVAQIATLAAAAACTSGGDTEPADMRDTCLAVYVDLPINAASPDSLLYRPPPIVRLSSEQASRASDPYHVLETVPPERQPVHSLTGWKMVDGDSVQLDWSTGFDALMVRLSTSGDSLSGISETWHDAGDGVRGSAYAVRVACPDVASTRNADGDTIVTLARTESDLTGDGTPELLLVVGTGPSLDSLARRFTIESAGRVLFEDELMPMTRTIGFDAGKRVLSEDEHRARLDEFQDWFFGDHRFRRFDDFVDELRRSFRVDHMSAVPDSVRGRVWDELEAAGVMVFQYSSGGDGIGAIAWSDRDQRFYQLLQCC